MMEFLLGICAGVLVTYFVLPYLKANESTLVADLKAKIAALEAQVKAKL